jgi:hypothetical protein
MRFGWALLAGLICLIIWLLRNAAGEMLKEEMQTRLCRIPNAVIRAAVSVFHPDLTGLDHLSQDDHRAACCR